MSLTSPSRQRALGGKSLIALVSFLFVVSLGFVLPPASATFDGSQEPSVNLSNKKRTRPAFVPGEALVRYKDEATAKRQLTAEAVQSAEGKRIPIQVESFEGAEIVSGLRMAHMAAEDTIAAIEALNKQPDVLYAEPNYIWKKDRTPNDPRFGEQYGLSKIGAPQAWDTTTGSSNIVIGVIDEGIDINHPDLQANIWTNPGETAGNGVDDDNNGFIDDVHGYNFAASPRTGSIPAEDHATHVAGIAGAVGNNGIGISGVNWNVRLMSLRTLGPFGGDTADFINAYNYARQMRELWVSSNGTIGANLRVLNNSYGGDGFSQSVFDAISALNQSGILFVASAGNVSENSDVTPHYPSGYALPNVIAVASTTSADALAFNSTFGAQSVTLGAPGASILSTTPNNTYSTFSGTSMASPHVAGSAALILARALTTNTNLTVQQLRALVSFNGDLIPALSGKTLTGRRMNLSSSLQALGENDVTPPGTPSLSLNAQNGRMISLGWINSGDDGASGQASLYQISFIDSTSGAVIPLSNVVPGASGSSQSLVVTLPFRHTSGTVTLRELDNVGNEGTPATLNVSVPLSEADPYATSLGPPVALTTGGTLLTQLTFDDRYKENHPLPFAFPYFGQSFNSVTISTNGNLYFSTPPKRGNGDADDVPSSRSELAKYKMISGLWDDIDLSTSSRGDAGVYEVQPGGGRIIFRWQGIPCNDLPDDGEGCTGGGPVNFEIELRSDGTIKTRYGSGNTDLLPVVGISGGSPDAYIIDSHTSEDVRKSLTNAQEVTFLPGGATPFPTPPPTTFFVSGRIVDSNNNPVSSVRILFERSFEGTTSTTTTFTDAAGNFSSGNLGCQNNVKVTPSRTGFTFNPTSLAFTSQRCLSDTATANFTSSGSGPATNPLEDRDYFVNQHYRDFLDRDADAGGLSYWSDQLAACGTDARCISSRRVGVSAAFFVELEFQRTGSFVYRLYKGGLARRPTFQEFNADRAQIVEGPTLTADKQALSLALVQRNEFVQKYAGKTTTATFVDALIASIQQGSNLDLTPQRDTLIDRYIAGVNMNQSRAFALREAIDSTAFVNQEYNAAFVLMQYFGYLRRDPDQGGYNFWLGIVNNPSVSNYRSMVCAFLTSAEYQSRFSTAVPRNDSECGNIN